MRCQYHAAMLAIRDGQRPSTFSAAPCWGEPAFAVVDCETTSLDPFSSQLVEVAVVLCDQDGFVERRWSTLVDAGTDFLPSVHGLRPQDVAGAPMPSEAAAKVASMVAGRVVVGHNVTFDLGVLHRSGAAVTYRTALCTFENLPSIGLTQHRSLRAVCERFGLSPSPNHRALSDAEATAALLRHLLERARFDGHSMLVPTVCVPHR